jgi:PAS domain S-box-containing protein
MEMKRDSLRSYITFSLVAVSVIPLVLFGLFFFSVLRTHLDQDIDSLSRSFLGAIAAQTSSRCLDGPRRVLPSILLFIADDPDQADENLILKRLQTPRPEYVSLFVLDGDGRIEAIYPETEVPEGAIGSPYALHAKPRIGETAFSSPFSSSIGGSVVVEASFTNGERTVVSLVDLGWLSARLVLMADSPRERLGVVDAEGRYIICSDPSRVQSGEKVPRAALGDARAVVDDATGEYYVSSAPIPDSAWRAVFFRPRGDVDAPLVSFVLRLGFLALAALACAVLVAVVTWRRFSGSLAKLLEGIARISAGDYGERIGDLFTDEFREIAGAFNAMSDSIARRDARIQESEERYRLFHANKVPALLLEGGTGAIRDANEAALAFYGYTPQAMLCLSMADLDVMPAQELLPALSHAALADGGMSSRHRLRSGELRDVESYVSAIDVGGSAHLHCVIIDVTERRLAEDRTRKALDEKTLLLQEVYHRVKNNLQIISSLLNMQASTSDDPLVSAALRSGQDRVYAMSLAHELVYEVPDVSSIELGDYARRLVAGLADTHGFPRARLAFEIEPITLDLGRAVPFGLALNELASNAIKYGMAPDGLLAIRLGRTGQGGSDVELGVMDNGAGMPAGFDPQKGAALGTYIVVALANQLGGTAFWEARPDSRGTVARLRFPIEAP